MNPIDFNEKNKSHRLGPTPTKATKRLPVRPASVPIKLTPPDIPGGTERKLRMEKVFWAQRIPISPLTVSAQATAMEETNAK